MLTSFVAAVNNGSLEVVGAWPGVERASPIDLALSYSAHREKKTARVSSLLDLPVS